MTSLARFDRYCGHLLKITRLNEMILFSSDACMPACKYWRECFSAAGLAVVAVKSRKFKSTTCVQKQVIRILCASLEYKERVIRIHSNKIYAYILYTIPVK